MDIGLTPKRFYLMAQDGYGNTLSTQGGVSLLTLRLYAHYRLECLIPKGMNPISSPFKTDGAISGGIAAMNIRGDANIVGGKIYYNGELRRFRLSNIELTFDSLDYQTLMHLLQYPSDTNTTLSGMVELKGFDRRDITGAIHLATLTKHFNPTPIMEDDNTTFSLRELLADEFGRVKAFKTNITIDASFEHAGVLEQLAGVALAGELTLKGKLQGDEKLLKLKATSNVAQSDTKFTLIISDLEPSSITFDLRAGDVEQTFHLFDLPSPIRGKITAYTELNTTQGFCDISIQDAQTLPTILKEHYNLTQPPLRFSADLNINMDDQGVHYRTAFTSDLTRMAIDGTTTHAQMLQELLKTLR
ncbi:MAG: hypothetical protein IE883_05555 [Epsilonproteobacteria bacterium]|nr:hypothetical protein [Campylobacterota bacterium]